VSVTAGLMVDLLTRRPPLAVGVSVATAVWDNVRRLTDELEVVHVMQTLSGDRAYANWLPLNDIVAAMPAERRRDEAPELDAGMQSRGLLEQAAGMYRAVR
jgi:hypothetical protein